MFLLTDDRPAFDAKGLLNTPFGMVSPLWGYFAGMTVAGLAFWSFTRLAKPQNLEAFFGHLPTAGATVAPQPILALVPSVPADVAEAVAAPAEAVEEIVDAVTAPVIQATETVSAPLAEAVEAAPAPVGGEAAPISPIVADEPARVRPPKARKSAEPRSVAPIEPSADPESLPPV